MKSRRKSWWWTLSGALFLVLLVMVYVRIGLLPGSLRETAMQRLESWTGKKIVFDRLVFVPFHGFSFYKVGVFEQNGTPLFRARRVTLNARLLPFLQEKKIIVDRCLLERPVLDWSPASFAPPKKEAPPKTVISGQIEVPVAGSEDPRLEDLAGGADMFLPENVYLQRIEISDGRITLRSTPDGEPTETLSSVNIRLTMPHSPMLRFEGRVDIGDKPYAYVDLTGVWDLDKGRYEFDLKSATDRVPTWLLRYQKDHFLILREGAVSFEAKLFSQNEQEVFFRVKAGLRQARLVLEPSVFSGQMRLEAEGSFDPVWRKITRYRGSLDLIKVRAENLSKTIESLESLTGHIKFEPDLLVIRTLKGEYRRVAFDATGTVRSFKQLWVDGQIRSALTVEQLRSLLPEKEREKIRDFTLSGDVEALTLLGGSLKKGSKIDTEYKVLVHNGSVRNDAKKIRWSRLSGEIQMNQEGIRLTNASFLMAEKPCKLNAFIPRSPDDPGEISLQWSDYRLTADYKMRGEDIHLQNGTFGMPGFSGSLSGQCLHWSKPVLQLKGAFTADLKVLSGHLTSTRPELAALKLSGKVSGPWTLSGPAYDPMRWDLKLDGDGAPLRYDQWFRIDELKFQARYKDGMLEIPIIRAAIYGGTIGAKIRADLRQKTPPFEVEAYLNNLNLAGIARDKIPPNEKMKGNVVGNATLSGTAGRPSTYRGEGSLNVTNGYLGQSDQFKKMGQLPLVKVEGLDLVTFEQMQATFKIADQKVFTDDLRILGDSVDLTLSGSMGFDQSLDMVMDIQYSDAIWQGASLTGGLAPLMVRQASNLIGQQRVSGTLKTPRYEKILLPTGRSIGNKLSGLVKSIAS